MSGYRCGRKNCEFWIAYGLVEASNHMGLFKKSAIRSTSITPTTTNCNQMPHLWYNREGSEQMRSIPLRQMSSQQRFSDFFDGEKACVLSWTYAMKRVLIMQSNLIFLMWWLCLCVYNGFMGWLKTTLSDICIEL